MDWRIFLNASMLGISASSEDIEEMNFDAAIYEDKITHVQVYLIFY